MAAPDKKDAKPQGLSWGDDDDQETKVSPVRARASEDVKGLFASTQLGAGAAPPAEKGGFFPSTPVGQKSPFVKTQQGTGSVAVPAPPPPSGDLSTISRLFGDETVPAPPLNGEEYSEAELSWQAARKKRDLLNDRLSSVVPVPAPEPIAAPPSPAKKATLVGGLSAQPPAAAAAPSPPRASAFAATVVAPQKPAVAPAPPPPPEAALVDAADDVGKRGSKPQRKARRGKAAPPPTPNAAKVSPLRAPLMAAGGLTLLLVLGLAGGYVGLYELPAEAETILVDAGLRDPKPAAAPPRANTKPKPTAKPAADAPKPAAAAPATAPAAASAPKPKQSAKAVEQPRAAMPKPTAPSPTAKAASPEAPKAAQPLVTQATPTAAPKASPEAPKAEPAEDARDDGAALAESARRKLLSGDVDGAEALVRSVLARDPSEHHAMEVFARVLLAQGKPSEALGYVQKIIRKRSKRAAYRVLEGDVLIRMGDPTGARAAWNTANELDPGNAEARRRLTGR